MSSSPMPWIIPQFFTDTGEMASFYQLFSYQINSTTKQDTFADSGLITANDNPLVLDAYGRAPIFLSLTSYKFVLATPTAADPPDPADIVWTAEDVPAYGTGFTNFDITGVAGEDTDADHSVVYLESGSESRTAGRWYLTNAGDSFSSSSAVAIGVAVAPILAGETGTIRIAGRAEGFSSPGLTEGALYYLSDATAGLVTSTPPAQNVVVLGKADSTSTLIIEPAWGSAGATFAGLMGIGAQTLSGVKTFSSQPSIYIGTATTQPALAGGVFFTDVTPHNIGINQTNTVLSSTTIPANALNADGKAVRVRFGSGVLGAGTNSFLVKINLGGTIQQVIGTTTANNTWQVNATFTRLSSSIAEMSSYAESTFTVQITTMFVIRFTGLDFTNAITLESLMSTGTDNTNSQTFFVAEML